MPNSEIRQGVGTGTLASQLNKPAGPVLIWHSNGLPSVLHTAVKPEARMSTRSSGFKAIPYKNASSNRNRPYGTSIATRGNSPTLRAMRNSSVRYWKVLIRITIPARFLVSWLTCCWTTSRTFSSTRLWMYPPKNTRIGSNMANGSLHNKGTSILTLGPSSQTTLMLFPERSRWKRPAIYIVGSQKPGIITLTFQEKLMPSSVMRNSRSS